MPNYYVGSRVGLVLGPCGVALPGPPNFMSKVRRPRVESSVSFLNGPGLHHIMRNMVLFLNPIRSSPVIVDVQKLIDGLVAQ